MTRFSTGLAFGLLVLLSACDSGTETDALVGTWSFGETTHETYVTVSEAQPFYDTASPATGTIAFSGTETGVFRYFTPFPTSEGVQVKTQDNRYGPHQANNAFLGLTPDKAYFLQNHPGVQLAQYTADISSSSFSYANGTLTVQALTLRTADGRGVVTVSAGSMSVHQIPLEAGRNTLVQTEPVPRDAQPGSYLLGDRIAFRDDGTFRSETNSYEGVRGFDGTWTTAGQQLRLSRMNEGVRETETFDFSVDRGRLRLTSATVRGCVNEQDVSGCLVYGEGTFGLRRGTLTAISGQDVSQFERSATASR